MRIPWTILVLSVLLLSTGPVSAPCQADPLAEGIRAYQRGEYARAVEQLKQARDQSPASSSAAFFLGMAYKQQGEYQKALDPLKAAATLRPRIKEAVLELAYTLLKIGKDAAAMKWIQVAEQNRIFPAKTAFLKGLIRKKQGRAEAAVAALEKAASLDPDLAQAVGYQIGLVRIQSGALKQAQSRLETAISLDPQTELAAFARRLQDRLARRIRSRRPWRFHVAVLGQYDSNVVLKPGDSQAASDITDENSLAMTTTAGIDYFANTDGPWRFRGRYRYYGRFHQHHSTSHDQVSNHFSFSPGYDFGGFVLDILASYRHTLLRDPGYQHYTDELSIGPLLRTGVGKRHVLAVYAGYGLQEYIQPPTSAHEDRDSERYEASLSWIWLFARNGYLNCRYRFSDENSDGVNWENQSHQLWLAADIPLWGAGWSLQTGGAIELERFDNPHTSFEKKRADETYSLFAGLDWEFWTGAHLILQYDKTVADSNLAIYDYDRDIYSLGLEYRF